MTCITCGHSAKEHTDRLGRCHADSCTCLAYVMTDSRLAQMRALVDDTRTLAADIQEQRPSDSLARLGVYMNWALQALDHAEKELSE